MAKKWMMMKEIWAKVLRKTQYLTQLEKLSTPRGGADPDPVTTDDGEKIEVNVRKTNSIFKIQTLKPQVKLKFTRELQMAKTYMIL